MALPLSYNLRNLRVRWQVTLLAIFGIALVVTVFVFLAAMSSGFRIALRSTGRPDNAIVLQKGSQSELGSGIDRGRAGLLAVDERIARGSDGQPLASGEIVVVANLSRKLDGADVNVLIRGVSLRAFDVRGGIRIVRGRNFTPGLAEVVVGARTSERFGLDVGSKVPLGNQDWDVVGVFTSEGSGFESEIWGDVSVMSEPLRRQGVFQALVVRLADPAAFDAFKKTYEEDPQVQVTVNRERKFYEDQAGPTASALMGLAVFVSVVMGIGAVFGAMNTMYAIVAARTREIGTLRALGFSRRSILLAFVMESVVLAFIGGLLGCVLALPANGVTSATSGANFSELAFAFRITASALATGLIFAMVMGLVGGLLPAFRAARLPIASALRAA
ncbi:MAG: multidrug ABC transporter permease [Acidobacteria bacterium]|nr:MAG: multidrug ABC transporter permease [Acidobacteriota bacterium]